MKEHYLVRHIQTQIRYNKVHHDKASRAFCSDFGDRKVVTGSQPLHGFVLGQYSDVSLKAKGQFNDIANHPYIKTYCEKGNKALVELLKSEKK